MFTRSNPLRKRIILAAALGGGLLLLGWAVVLPLAALAEEPPEPGTELHVANIFAGGTGGSTAKKSAFAYVTIEDEHGNRVNGARVVGNWSGCTNETGASGTTESLCSTNDDGTITCTDGVAEIYGKKKVNCMRKQCLFTLTITAVEKDGMTYVPGITTGSGMYNPGLARATSPSWRQGSGVPVALATFQKPQPAATSPTDAQDAPCGCGGE